MMDLSYEQLEDLVRAEGIPAMLDDGSRRRVTLHRVVRNRLRSACFSQRPAEGFSFRVHAAVREAMGSPLDAAPRRRVYTLWPAVISAAAVLLVVIVARPLLLSPPPGSAGQNKVTQAVLAHIHEEHSLYGRPSIPFTRREQFLREIKSTTGLTPVLPGQGRTEILGGGAPIFFGEHAAAYVLKTSDALVTVVVMRRPPDTLNFDHCWTIEDGDGRRWACGYKTEKMVARRIGDLTYCAIGRLTHQQLSDILDLISASAQH